jgi:hypothetical protein
MREALGDTNESGGQMKPVIFLKQTATLCAAACLIAGTAWAAQSEPGHRAAPLTMGNHQLQAALAPDQDVPSQDKGEMRRTLIQAKLQKTLQQAGFKKVQIMDPAYVVQAETPDGQEVLMLINGHSTSMLATQNASSAGGSSPTP